MRFRALIRSSLCRVKAVLPMLLVMSVFVVPGGVAGGQSRSGGVPRTRKGFEKAADRALLAMQRRAGELGIQGVAVVASFDGETMDSWSSKALVVGKLRVEPSANDKGSNLLAIAYAKAAEMANTLRDSGSGVRPPLTGEFGWTGGVMARSRTGYVIAAFSGGRGEDDVETSRAGLKELKAKL